MKKLFLNISAFAFLAVMAGCGGQTGAGGQLVGNPNMLNYRAPVPIGMVFVPSGVLKMGASDQDIRGKNDAMIYTAQMTGFYMDATEISVAEYRQFTNYVRDSIAHTIIGDFIEDAEGGQRVDFRKKINYRDAEVQDQLAQLYIPADQSGWGAKEFNNGPAVMQYHYETFDYEAAVANPAQNRADFVRKYDVPVYPDTTVWIRQFAYSYNEPIALQYNWFPAFNNYPVVGVTWNQCNAFCRWRTNLWKTERERTKQYFEGDFRLPNEMQWEWAARGGRNESPYPWGGPYIVNKKGCYLANFKPNRGNYAADGGLYTVPVDKYYANGYGLYNMAGNVAEWTSSPYFGSSYQAVADVNPEVQYRMKESDPQWMKRRVVRGGSWRDVAFYLQNSTRDWEYADTAKSYIGFRCIYQEIARSLTNSTRP